MSLLDLGRLKQRAGRRRNTASLLL